mmetsp:Transcript_139747/g.243368  ORF Transcript_139747/g.243368 Transcript_139747/m.243368 type:complete len:318 (+) Transcript_139747:74-1027(+)
MGFPGCPGECSESKRNCSQSRTLFRYVISMSLPALMPAFAESRPFFFQPSPSPLPPGEVSSASPKKASEEMAPDAENLLYLISFSMRCSAVSSSPPKKSSEEMALDFEYFEVCSPNLAWAGGAAAAGFVLAKLGVGAGAGVGTGAGSGAGAGATGAGFAASFSSSSKSKSNSISLAICLLEAKRAGCAGVAAAAAAVGAVAAAGAAFCGGGAALRMTLVGAAAGLGAGLAAACVAAFAAAGAATGAASAALASGAASASSSFALAAARSVPLAGKPSFSQTCCVSLSICALYVCVIFEFQSTGRLLSLVLPKPRSLK